MSPRGQRQGLQPGSWDPTGEPSPSLPIRAPLEFDRGSGRKRRTVVTGPPPAQARLSPDRAEPDTRRPHSSGAAPHAAPRSGRVILVSLLGLIDPGWPPEELAHPPSSPPGEGDHTQCGGGVPSSWRSFADSHYADRAPPPCFAWSPSPCRGEQGPLAGTPPLSLGNSSCPAYRAPRQGAGQPRCFGIEESPGSTKQGWRVTPAGGDPRDSATESRRPGFAPGHGERVR